MVIEARLSAWQVWHGLPAAARARDVFSHLRVWDTEHNNGVLIYVLMAERHIEIVADRGIARRVSQLEWDALCAGMGQAYANGQWRAGSLQGIAAAQVLLARHFPADGQPRADELPDRPLLL